MDGWMDGVNNEGAEPVSAEPQSFSNRLILFFLHSRSSPHLLFGLILNFLSHLHYSLSPLIGWDWESTNRPSLQWWFKHGVCSPISNYLCFLTMIRIGQSKPECWPKNGHLKKTVLKWNKPEPMNREPVSSAKDQGWMKLIKVALNQTFKG